MYGVSRFKGKIYEFPEHDIDPALKNAEWCLKYAEAIYSQYLRDRSGILYSKRDEMYLYRKYAEANQPVEKYMEILCPSDPHTHERKGFMNMSWDIVSIVPKFRAIIIGLFNKIDHDITANGINEKADEERMIQQWKMWAEKKLSGFFSQFGDEFDLQASTDDLPGLPESLEELQMFKEIGSFKLKEEISMEVALADSFYRSKWKDTKDKLYEDLFDLGIACVKDAVDPHTQAVQTSYIDPIDLIVRYSRSKTFDKISHAGFVDHMTISQLRTAVKNAHNSNMNEDDLKNVARQYSGYESNPHVYQYDYYTYDQDSGTYPYDEVTVDVLDCEWFSSDIVNFEKKKSESGESRVYRKDYDYSTNGNEKRTALKAEKKVVYRCKWLVGTPFVFDWGLQFDVPRPSKREANLSFHIYKLTNKSMLSQIISNVDDIQLAVLKLRNAAANAAPKGLSIEYDSLLNMSLGGQKMDPLEILTIYRRQGDIIYKATTHHSQRNALGGAKPVSENEGGIGALLNELLTLIDANLNMIRGSLGISQPVDGTTPPPKMLVGVGQMAQGAMNNVLQNLYKGYIFLKESTAKNMALRHQLVARYKERNVHKRSIGGVIVETLKIGAELTAMQFGIKLEARPNDEMKERVRTQATSLRVAAEQGRPGISAADYMFIERALENGNLKYAQAVMAYKEAKSIKEAKIQLQQNQIFARESSVVQEREKRETTVAKIRAEGEKEVFVESKKSQFRQQEWAQRHDYEMKQIAQKGGNEIGKTLIKTESDKEIVEKKVVSDETKEFIKSTKSEPEPATA